MGAYQHPLRRATERTLTMLQTEQATVEAVTQTAAGVVLRVSVPGDGGRYFFGVEADGDTARKWLATLQVGERIPLAGLPFARYNREMRRYEMWLTVSDPPQHRMTTSA